jgi:serine/threonine protein kinase
MRICPECGTKTTEHFCPNDFLPTIDETFFDRSADSFIGRLFDDKFEIIELIGHGGMSAVYKAYQRGMDRIVALKIMRQDLATDMMAVKRFYQEARSSSRLKHPNTIKVFDFGNSKDGFLYLSMEFLEGRSLSNILKEQGSLHLARIIKISLQILKSLAEAHSFGIIHRDLKPDNIFITKIYGEEDFVKILDFGLAKFIHGDKSAQDNLTRTGIIFGTPKYMSPEQASCEKLDPRTDLYSMGVIIYEMITGNPPFSADTPMGIVLKHIHDEPDDIREKITSPDIPHELCTLVMRLLEKNRNRRPSSSGEVIAEINAIIAKYGAQIFSNDPSQVAALILEGSQVDPAMAAKVYARSTAQIPELSELDLAGSENVAPVEEGISPAPECGRTPLSGRFTVPGAETSRNYLVRTAFAAAGIALIFLTVYILFALISGKNESKVLLSKDILERAEKIMQTDMKKFAIPVPKIDISESLKTAYSASKDLKPKYSLIIDSNPSDAQIFDANNRFIAKTPFRFEWEGTGSKNELFVVREGYKNYKLTIDDSLNNQKLLCILKKVQGRKSEGKSGKEQKKSSVPKNKPERKTTEWSL